MDKWLVTRTCTGFPGIHNSPIASNCYFCQDSLLGSFSTAIFGAFAAAFEKESMREDDEVTVIVHTPGRNSLAQRYSAQKSNSNTVPASLFIFFRFTFILPKRPQLKSNHIKSMSWVSELTEKLEHLRSHSVGTTEPWHAKDRPQATQRC